MFYHKDGNNQSTWSSGFLKKNHMIQNRRKFISTIAAGSIAVPLISDIPSWITDSVNKNFPVRLFSKPLDNYDFDFTCECVAASGIGGLDLTVRPGGKVEPAKVESSLPELIERARKYNLAVDMIVTGIASATEPYTEQILKAASGSGVKFYRLGWLNYDFKLGIWETLEKYRTSLRDLVELNKKYKIHGGYQNHSGILVGSPFGICMNYCMIFRRNFLEVNMMSGTPW